MPRQILLNDEARREILSGIAQVAEVVGATLGPRGQTVILSRQIGSALITKDGVTVARSISLADPWQNEGAKLVQEVAGRTDTSAGDGTTATVILTHAIYAEGHRHITAGADPQAIERGIALGALAAVASVRALALPVEQKNEQRLIAAATIAANGDLELGSVIGRAVSHAGLEGAYTLDPSPTPETTFQTTPGFQFERGLLKHPQFMTDPGHGMAVLAPCNVFVTDRRLIDGAQTQRILQTYMEKARSRPLLIVAEDCEGAALQTILANNRRQLPDGSMLPPICFVRTPGAGATRKDDLQDLAIYCGAKPFLVMKGELPETATIEDFGSADRVLVTPHRTTIVGGHGAPIVIDERKDELRARIKDPETKDFDRSLLERRLAALSASIVVIRIGSRVNSKLLEKRDRAQDAHNAAMGTLQEGIVPGGGVALARAVKAVEAAAAKLRGDQRLGALTVAAALTAPLRQLATNCGEPADVVIARVMRCRGAEGFNGATGIYEDLVEAGIVDSAKVVRLALENAAELAGLLLTAKALVVDVPEKQVSHA